jgi:hypothetical protein
MRSDHVQLYVQLFFVSASHNECLITYLIMNFEKQNKPNIFKQLSVQHEKIYYMLRFIRVDPKTP